MAKKKPKYQLFDRLRPEEYAALEADILKRGVKVAVETDENGDVLDGHHRKEIAEEHGLRYKTVVRKGMSEDEKREHVIMVNLARRNLEPWEWGRAFKLLLETKGVRRGQGSRNDNTTSETVSEVAATLGVDDRTARNRMAADDDVEALPAKRKTEVKAGKKTLARAIKEDKQAAKDTEDAKAAAKAKRAIKKGDDCNVFHGDSFKLAADIPDASCALIFTDPPYDKKSLPMYDQLGELAERLLVPGGSLITYIGQYLLPEVVVALSPPLKFFWPLCCRHTGDIGMMREYGVKIHWKPMLWFVKGDFRRDRETWVDDLVESQQEKDAHPWQQSLVEAMYYIDKLTTKGELVVDPFCGGGTTAVAAKELGRQWWTADVVAKCVQATRKRIDDAHVQ